MRASGASKLWYAVVEEESTTIWARFSEPIPRRRWSRST